MRYIGVDYHRRFSQMTMMDEKGRIIKEAKVSNTQGALKKFLDGCKDGKAIAVLEAGRNWQVMYDLLEEEMDEVKLAHPYKVKAIAEARIKTDKIDSKILAHLLRAELIPEAYVPSKQTRKAKDILRQRMFFIRLRTMVKNRILMILERHPEIKDRPGVVDLFGKTGRRWLGALKLSLPDDKLLKGSLELLDNLNRRIHQTDYLVEILSGQHPYVERLRTIPGIGKFLSVLIAFEIDDIKRFFNEKKFAGYIGIIPSTYASGTRLTHGRITKEGNKYLRWALIEAIWPAINKDNYLRAYYEKIKRTKGANQAKVATARRLATIIYRVLSEDRNYIVKDPAASY
ncbi:MAG: IS110 family transposase [Candidatus Omnitrophica bacterium]|nr:IS110 family transposase [Candidatus Omnitrophota bacterium]